MYLSYPRHHSICWHVNVNCSLSVENEFNSCCRHHDWCVGLFQLKRTICLSEPLVFRGHSGVVFTSASTLSVFRNRLKTHLWRSIITFLLRRAVGHHHIVTVTGAAARCKQVSLTSVRQKLHLQGDTRF